MKILARSLLSTYFNYDWEEYYYWPGEAKQGGGPNPERPVASEEQLLTYPNPTSNTVSVSATVDGEAELQIYNASGILLQTLPVQKGHNLLEINLGQYGHGLYIFKLVSNQDISTRKVVVQ